jgi:hypothetical protein
MARRLQVADRVISTAGVRSAEFSVRRHRRTLPALVAVAARLDRAATGGYAAIRSPPRCRHCNDRRRDDECSVTNAGIHISSGVKFAVAIELAPAIQSSRRHAEFHDGRSGDFEFGLNDR